MPRAEIIPITTAKEVANVVAAAAEDNHFVLYPSHAVVKHGEIVGYGSICTIPTAHIWLDTKKVTALDSIRLHRELDDLVRREGHGSLVTLCAESSPFYPHMRHFGYCKIAPMTLFLKNL